MLEVYQALIKSIQGGKRAVLATVISISGSAPQKAGAKMLIKEDGTSTGTVGGGTTEMIVIDKAPEVLRSGQPQVLNLNLSGAGEDAVGICGGEMKILLEPVLPPESVYLFGAGHVSQSIAPLAKTLGFRVIVIDSRPVCNNRDKFPEADELIVEEFEASFKKLEIAPDSYIIICTTNHLGDEKCLGYAVQTSAKYVGMLGSKKKVKEIKERLQKKGISSEKLERVHAPIGLWIGAVNPEEIAVSIMAEIIKEKRILSTTK